MFDHFNIMRRNRPISLSEILRLAVWLLASVIPLSAGQAQTASNPELLSKVWSAAWITAPSAPSTDYGVFHFRKNFALPTPPDHFLIHVSADNRYRLFVNGTSVSVGPARGDTAHWRYETVDIAPQLRAGSNVIAAVVWNFGALRPLAQMSHGTGLIVQGNSRAESAVNSDASWKVLRNGAITPVRVALKHDAYIVAGPGEQVDGATYPWDWQNLAFNDSAWQASRVLERGTPHGAAVDPGWCLVPRNIPPAEEVPQRFAAVRRCSGVSAKDEFLSGKSPWQIPAHTQATLLLDQAFETTAYPQLLVSGGRGSTVTLTYAEALMTTNGVRADSDGVKGNRNEIEGREMDGNQDRLLPDGGGQRFFSTLWVRTYRYVELKVETADQPLTIHDFHGRFTAYPFKENGSFTSDDPVLSDIWKVGWRTARLCAFETYMDCPYYEQMQYIGDTRIQSLISLYVSGDDRLMLNAIELFDQSRIPEGITQSRYPSKDQQLISTFSLFWIDMVHDYWMHRDDSAFVREKLVGIASVINWFEQRVDTRTGMLGPLPYWSFVDWPKEWPATNHHMPGQPKGAAEGGSSIITLQFGDTLEHAAELYRAFGKTENAEHCRKLAASLRAATMKLCWDEKRQLLADTPAKTDFSQHANVMAVLSGAVESDRARELIGRVAQDQNITECTCYFRFYLLQAMKLAGLGDQYVSQLQQWRDMLGRGLTTFAERPDPTRSDCHAWSASPTYEMLATVCGIEPASPGFKTVKIAPHFGYLTRIAGRMPHPAGVIEMQLTRTGDRIQGTITLPPTLNGEFVWHGHTIRLHSGKQDVELATVRN